ncbi:hypothetical protein [Clostridium tyrobutyricum]|uniref:hypothetical protein n=1 Tax=Clostridium tyrobutyricum TaxID=1519 RepID=UPI001C38D195|nr:hypothetical protein [Clostridium tyrobutyricum]MBV4441685.1 hypothetical protein [Clostridium tyrobutyricum]
MKQLLTMGLPYIIETVFLVIIYTLKACIQSTLESIESKSKQILGQTIYNRAKAYALDNIKYLLSKYPESTIEDIIAKGITDIENKFGTTYLTEGEIKAIISSSIIYMQHNLYDLLNDTVAAGVTKTQQKYLNGKIQGNGRKKDALENILTSLKYHSFTMTSTLKNTIDDKIEKAVFNLKTKRKMDIQDKDILQQQVTNSQTKLSQFNETNTQLNQENNQLRQKLSNTQSSTS